MTTTASFPDAVCAPVLTFGAQPHGQYPQVLLDDSSGDTVRAPSGGAPMRVLRDPKAVLACLDLHSRTGPGAAPPRIVMAGAHPVTGILRGCPLTGAEQQSADGGLLNMNPPHLTGDRRQLSGLFSAAAAESSRPAAQACAAGLVTRLAAAGREADVAAGYATQFAAAIIVQTLGAGDWPQIKAWSDVAFGVVRSPAAVSQMDAVWAELYSHFGTSRLGGLAAAIAARLTGHTTDQVAHVLATVSNGFGAVPPVLTRVLIELLRRPGAVTACLRRERSWRAVVRHLIGTRVMFPVAPPRLVLADTRLGAHLVKAGTLVLPSLIGAVQAGAPATIAFGPGPHLCPGAALTWAWTEVAVVAFSAHSPARSCSAHLIGSQARCKSPARRGYGCGYGRPELWRPRAGLARGTEAAWHSTRPSTWPPAWPSAPLLPFGRTTAGTRHGSCVRQVGAGLVPPWRAARR